MSTPVKSIAIFLATAPGLEAVLCDEARSKGFRRARAVPGGVEIEGGWPDVWRANLWLRGANRVLARIDRFPVDHLTALDKRARRFQWGAILKRKLPFRVEASCSKSRIYHTAAAAERVATAIVDTFGAPHQDDALVTIMLRIENDVCTISVDTSGELLHKRGYKIGVNRAPMRETMAALFLRQCGFDGREPVVDPMCGSGTFVIEAAEIAAGLNPGRARAFAFEQLATFDAAAWQALRTKSATAKAAFRGYGSDRDEAAIAMSRDNAARAGVAPLVTFEQRTITELEPPVGGPGLVIVNPPYGDRIGDKQRLATLYQSLGQTLSTRFKGWRVGLITSEKSLAKATNLPFKPTGAPVAHGGVRVTLHQTDPLV